MTDTFNVLITGASRGIGLELARQYAEQGLSDGQQVNVLATCRDPHNAPQLVELKLSLQRSGHNNLAILPLDVADEQNVAHFAQLQSNTPIDILINNAGIYGENAPLLPVNVDLWHKVFHLNAIAPILLTQHLTDNLKLSRLKKVVTISSDMGSIGDNTGGGAYLYRSSKSALNSAMYSLSLDFKPFDITVMMLHPGHVQTDMGGPNAKVPVEDSVNGLRRVIDEVDNAQSGAFRNWLGEPMPW